MSPPTRFSSVRVSNRPAAVQPPVSRDDSGLTTFRSFRYEKTVAAEPPVQYKPTTKRASTLPPREPSLKRSPSSSTTTSSSANSCAASASAVSLAGTAATSIHGGSVVVVAAPSMRLILPSIPPPTEIHPALRSPAASLLDERKRDSGHGSAIMKDTIHEEERLNVVGLSEHDDCFVESRQRWRKQPMTSNHTAATSSPATPESSANTAPATFGPGNSRRQAFLLPANEARPATATACLVTSGTYYGAGAPSKNSSACATGAAPTNGPNGPKGRPATITVAARASNTSPSSILAPLDLHVTSTASSPSSSSSSRNKLPPPTLAAAITVADFLPAPSSQPSSPSRSSSRAKLFRRQSLRISSLWGARDDSATTRPNTSSSNNNSNNNNTQHRAPRRRHSSSQLRGTSTDAVGDSSLARDITIPGSATCRQPAGAAAATPVAPASAKLQPPVVAPLSPARSCSRSSSRAMSSSPDLHRESAAADFSPLVVSIDTESLLDDSYITSMHFSTRGSYIDPDNILAMGRMSITDDDRSATPTQNSSVATAPQPASSATSYAAADGLARAAHRAASPAPDMPGIMTPDVEQESQKVRQLYASGSPPASLRDTSRQSHCDRLEPTPEVLTEDNDSAANGNTLAPSFSVPNSVNYSSNNDATAHREPTDPAGGFEDWDDLDSNLVDRYGFIGTPRSQSRVGTPTEMRQQHRSPRRRNVLTKRDPMGFAASQGGVRIPSRKVSARSLNTQHSEISLVSFRSSRSVIRQAGNLLPQNRNRRWMDDAGDMLTVSPNLQDSVEEARVEKISEALKQKEIERSEKWRRMARVIRNGDQGQGMEFDFDTRNPKLIERTWKGIPDRWRAAAWWSFLATAARENGESATEGEITADFQRLQDCACADDTQIDLDVPRTISRHVMFRRRYRGGQRLLFRVLHALSLYFPETGYVQGMASLAATLLCYFDEEKCFVMLVRMWRLRGLERLYRPPGFQGLLAALGEFQSCWLHRDLAAKLVDLDIPGTSYGTRWYLTLFNHSIPFGAQLRVWDVFLLLGSPARGELPPPQTDSMSRLTPKPSNKSLVSLPSIQEKPATPPPASTAETVVTTPSSGLDVLHAASAALFQALREVLLDADFENSMKALTAWIPIKDEDLLMKVTRAEWKTQLKKRS